MSEATKEKFVRLTGMPRAISAPYGTFRWCTTVSKPRLRYRTKRKHKFLKVFRHTTKLSKDMYMSVDLGSPSGDFTAYTQIKFDKKETHV